MKVVVVALTLSGLSTSGCSIDEETERVEDDQLEVVLGSAEPNYAFPWVVRIDGNLSCHGVLISQRWVLTAAHCLDSTFSGVTVSYTRTNLAGQTTTGSQQTGVGSTFQHPDYDPFDFHDDIGLIRLARTFPSDPLLRPALLPFAEDSIGTQGLVASTVRQNGSLPAGNAAVLRGPIILTGPRSFSVKTPTASLCPGDSGSGFITTSFGETIVSGIAANTSAGSTTTCTQPNVEFEAMQVAAYEDWIHSVSQIPTRHLIDRTAEFGTPGAAGAPTTAVTPGLGVHNILHRDTSGRLHELWRDSQGITGTSNLTALAGAPNAVGNPAAYVDWNSSTILLYRAPDSAVHGLYWSTGAVGHDNLSGAGGAPPASSDPIGWFGPDGFNHVVYRTSNGHLRELYWFGAGGVGHGDLTGSSPTAVGTPAAYADARGTNVVAYRGSDAHVHSLSWTTGAVGHDDLSGFAGTAPAAGDPVAYYIPVHDLNQVAYRGSDGHVWELYWQGVGAVAGWNVTAAVGAPPAAGKPAAFYSAGTNTKHIVYRSSDGRLHDIAWVPGLPAAHLDLTEAFGAPTAADGPAAFTIDGPNRHHLAYRGTDNHIYEVIW